MFPGLNVVGVFMFVLAVEYWRFFLSDVMIFVHATIFLHNIQIHADLYALSANFIDSLWLWLDWSRDPSKIIIIILFKKCTLCLLIIKICSVLFSGNLSHWEIQNTRRWVQIWSQHWHFKFAFRTVMAWNS